MKTFREFIIESNAILIKNKKDYTVSDTIIRVPKIIEEIFGQEKRLQDRIKNTKDQKAKQALRDKLKKVQKRNKMLKSVSKRVTSRVKRSSRKPLRHAKNFIVKTAIGALLPF